MIYILSALAYGDFVVDCYATSKITFDYKIIAPNYLRVIANEIDYKNNIYFIDIGPSNIPPDNFNINQKGLYSAIKSTFDIRNSLSAYPNDSMIYYHHNDFRWRLINYPRKFNYIREKHQDIYEAYDKLFNLPSITPESFNPESYIYIFPESRQKWKTLPTHILNKLIKILTRYDLNFKIILHRDDVYFDSRYVLKVSSISELVSKIKEAGAVISVDSLPAHLANYFNKNLFIYTPNLKINKAIPIYVAKNNFITEFNDEHFINIQFWLSKILIT
jgi:hypothetical protein